MKNLASDPEKKHMKSYTIDLKKSSRKPEFSSHRGEEFLLVLKGEVNVFLHNKKETLKEGDSIYYVSLIPHRVESVTDESTILAVVYDEALERKD